MTETKQKPYNGKIFVDALASCYPHVNTPSSFVFNRIRYGHQISDHQHGLDAADRPSVRLLREAGEVLAVHWRGGALLHDCLPPPSRRVEAPAPLFGHAREPNQAIIMGTVLYRRNT
jgi:hypothetical protein